MEKNMGNLDRLLRIVVAGVIGFLWWQGSLSGMLGNILALLAVIFLLTSAIGFCPLYKPFGINTCEPQK